jgi:NADH-quinone oxidoreductase subunit J
MISSVLAQVSDDVNVAQNIGFYIIAAGMLAGAFRVVTSNNVVHAALWLVVVLAGVAAQYILAAAEFVAVSQVLVYIGAVMVLFLFGIMLTRAKIGSESNLNNANWALGIPVALLLLGTMTWAILDAFGDDKLPDAADSFDSFEDRGVTTAISDNVLSNYIVPFLALSFILLAAAVGAIVLARKD